MATQEPGFCYWLRIGVLVSYLSAVIGLVVLLLGVGNSAEAQGIVTAVAGVLISLQSMVFASVLQALLWIVARLNHNASAASTTATIPAEIEPDEEYDGIRHKPVLKRRRVE